MFHMDTYIDHIYRSYIHIRFCTCIVMHVCLCMYGTSHTPIHVYTQHTCMLTHMSATYIGGT